MMKRAVPLEDLVEGADQPLRRAVRASERVDGAGLGAGSEIRGEVRAAEAVDSLLGVADKDQAPRGGAIEEDALEDGELARIGVLRLVDQGDVVALGKVGESRSDCSSPPAPCRWRARTGRQSGHPG